jgi:hypothetical protein
MELCCVETEEAEALEFLLSNLITVLSIELRLFSI